MTHHPSQLTPQEAEAFGATRTDDPEMQRALALMKARGILAHPGCLITFTLWKQQADAAEALIQSLPSR